MNTVFIFFGKIQIGIGIILLPVAFGVLFLGRAYIDFASMALNSVCLTFSIMWVLYAIFFGRIHSYTLHWILFVAILIASIAVSAWLSMNKITHAVGIACFFHGAVIGLLLCTAVQLEYAWVTYSVTVILGALSALGSY